MAKTSKALDRLVQKALKNENFRVRLESDPKAALEELKIYTPERLAAVKRLSWLQLQRLAEAFGYDRGGDAN